MEPGLFFTEFVLTMCAVHLTWKASAHIDLWWNKNIRTPARKSDDAERRGGLTPQRSDWYAFFHCSDLTGKEPGKLVTATSIQGRTTQTPQTTSSANLPRQSKRPEARLTFS